MESDDFTRYYIIRYLSLFYWFLLDRSLTKSVNVYAANNSSRTVWCVKSLVITLMTSRTTIPGESWIGWLAFLCASVPTGSTPDPITLSIILTQLANDDFCHSNSYLKYLKYITTVQETPVQLSVSREFFFFFSFFSFGTFKLIQQFFPLNCGS